MAIPTWLADDGWQKTEDAPSVADLDRAADAVAALSHASRLEILAALDRTGTATYTELKAETTIDDNGKLNYHLRQLDGLVADDAAASDAYALTTEGERVLELVLDEALLANVSDD